MDDRGGSLPDLEAWRRTCAHVSGASMGTTVAALRRHGVLGELLARAEPVAVGELVGRAGLRPGYARLAMELLATQDLAAWSDGRERIGLTADGRRWAAAADVYGAFPRILEHAVALRGALAGEPAPVAVLARAIQELLIPDGRREVDARLRSRLDAHLRGPLVAVAARSLAGVRAFARIARGPLGWCPLEAIDLPLEPLRIALRVLEVEGWVVLDGDLVRLTDLGARSARWATLHGYVVGYMGIQAAVPALLDARSPVPPGATQVSAGADRELLLAGKSLVFSRGGLREVIEEWVVEIFDREPVAGQPRLLLDMSAGDGVVLERLAEAIATRSRRGRELERHPLALVGLVGNAVARERAERRLVAAGVQARLLSAPIEDPDAVARELASVGLDLREALVVSKTCIHGRRYVGGRADLQPAAGVAPSRAVFVSPDGEAIDPADLEADLTAFFARWARWVGRHGMLAVDTHSVPAEVAAATWPLHVVTHVCATHGYSAQYLVEPAVFRRAAARAGLASRRSRDLGTELIGATSLTADHLVPEEARW